jgi:hypothetical protein
MSAAISTPTLSDQDLAELLALIKGADSVELKLTVPVSDRSRTSAALGIDPLDSQVRQVYFFDTPDLALYKNGLGLDDLSTLGPIFVLKLKFKPEGYDRKLVAEVWLYPDNSMILELSTKCAPSEAFDVGVETRAFLTAQDVDVTGEQETKTKKALEFFTERLQPERAADS